MPRLLAIALVAASAPFLSSDASACGGGGGYYGGYAVSHAPVYHAPVYRSVGWSRPATTYGHWAPKRVVKPVPTIAPAPAPAAAAPTSAIEAPAPTIAPEATPAKTAAAPQPAGTVLAR